MILEQSEGFEGHNRASHVCRLRRALYGIDSYFLGMGFTESEVDSSLYYILVKGEPLILVLYVDDLFLTGSEKLIVDCKRDLVVEFEMKDLGLIHHFLGLEMWQKDGQIFLGQGKYVVEILKQFGMQDLLRFVYLGKWSPCGCGSLTTKGKYLTHYCALYFMSNFTLTFFYVKRVKFVT
jgi:hypothetical protein